MEFALARFRNQLNEKCDCVFVLGHYFPLKNLVQACKSSAGIASLACDIDELIANWGEAFPNLCTVVDYVNENGLFETRQSELVLQIDGSWTIDAPIKRPGKVMCAAANYKAHVAEMAKTGFTGPTGSSRSEPRGELRPYHFLKATSCMVGPNNDIILPSAEHRIDWEVELGAIIAPAAKSVSATDALEFVAGFVLLNDVSCRAATWRDDRPNVRSDWLAGKSYDTFLPLGPHFVPRAFVKDYRKLLLQLWVNGDLQQSGTAGDMIFNLEQQIEYLSHMLTLEPGDLIATGTPAGVGQGQGKYLKPGDLVEAEIDGFGRQTNLVRL